MRTDSCFLLGMNTLPESSPLPARPHVVDRLFPFSRRFEKVTHVLERRDTRVAPHQVRLNPLPCGRVHAPLLVIDQLFFAQMASQTVLELSADGHHVTPRFLSLIHHLSPGIQISTSLKYELSFSLRTFCA